MAAEEVPGEEAVPIRVLVANLSGVLQHLVKELIEQQTDMQLTGEVQGTIEVLEAAGENVDIVVHGAEHPYPLPGICSHLLSEYPNLRILVVAPSGEEAVLYWLGLRRQQLRKVSSANLLKSIRRAHRLNPAI